MKVALCYFIRSRLPSTTNAWYVSAVVSHVERQLDNGFLELLIFSICMGWLCAIWWAGKKCRNKQLLPSPQQTSMNEIHRLDLNDFPIPQDTLHYPWGYSSLGTPCLSTLITGTLLLSEKAVIPKGLYSTSALQAADQRSFYINWKVSYLLGSIWGSYLVCGVCGLHILTEPSTSSYQLFPEFNYYIQSTKWSQYCNSLCGELHWLTLILNYHPE